MLGLCDDVVPQGLVQTEACEVEETQIFFCDHAAEVITVKTTATREEMCRSKKHRMSTKC